MGSPSIAEEVARDRETLREIGKADMPKTPVNPQHGSKVYRGKTPANIRSLARAHTEKAIEVLHHIMCNGDAQHSARITAAQELLSRGWGKPAQTIEATTDKRVEVIIRDATSPLQDRTGAIDVTPVPEHD